MSDQSLSNQYDLRPSVRFPDVLVTGDLVLVRLKMFGPQLVERLHVSTL